MDVSVLQAFVKPEMGVLLVVLWVVGYAIKRIQQIADEWIIFIVSAIGILGAAAISKGFTIDAVFQGIICAAVAVYGNQVVKQATKLNKAVDNEIEE